MKRFGSANWQGNGLQGKGTVTTHSGVLKDVQYSYASRFESGTGTNPEELIAAAHAGCFSMKLSFLLADAGFTPKNIDTHCEITLDPAKGEITNSHLKVNANVPGITKEKFDELVADASKTCPVSKLLKATITHEAIVNQ